MRPLPLLLLLLFPLSALPQTPTQVSASAQIKGLEGGPPPASVEACPSPALSVEAGELIIGKNWSSVTPCLIPLTTRTISLTQPARAKLNPDYPINPSGINAAGLAYVYLAYLGQERYEIHVALRNPDRATCSGCVINTTLRMNPMFPSMAIPIGTWRIEDKAAPAVFTTLGFNILESQILQVGEGIALVMEVSPGVWLLRLDRSSREAAPTIVPAPVVPTAPCEAGDTAYSATHAFRCVHIRELYLQDQRVYRWVRMPLELAW